MPSRPSADQPRLSIINEDSDVLNPLPSRPAVASHRPFARRWRDKPPAANYDLSPPKYSVWDVSGPRGEKLMDMRNNKYLVRRGGWKRLCIALLVLATIAIALGVGLGVGLNNRSSEEDNELGQPSSDNSNNSDQPFPLGSYSFSTNLVGISADCTANPSTWTCYPYTTYNESTTQSNATFNWIIEGSPENLTISSSENPFSITFNQEALTLNNADSDDEHYSFSITLDQRIFPNEPLTNDDRIAACYFNSTVVSASLFTRRSAQLPDNGGDGTTPMWTRWPGTVEVLQSIPGGQDVPNCYVTDNGRSVSRITEGLAPQPNDSTCSCSWRDFDLEDSN